MPDRDPKTLTFTFTPKQNGPFEYGLPETWDYIHGDELVFESPVGPFSVLFEPKPEEHHADINGPLEGNENLLVSDAGPETFTASGRVLSSLTAADRRDIHQANGKIGTYIYKIAVRSKDSSGTLRDATKNGSYDC